MEANVGREWKAERMKWEERRETEEKERGGGRNRRWRTDGEEAKDKEGQSLLGPQQECVGKG